MDRDAQKRLFWLICFALAAVTVILYAPILNHDFIDYDDYSYVVKNDPVQNGITFDSLVWAFTTGHSSNWHPLTWISHMIDFQLFGVDHPGGHHLISLLFHVANSLLLFGLLNRMTGAMWRSAIVAALFAWHPLHVESVAWVAERKDVLSAFFWMLTMLMYVRYAENVRQQSSRRKTFYCVSLLFFALGLMSKPMVVTLPFVLLLMDVWPLRRTSLLVTSDAVPSPTPTAPTALVWEKIPFFVLAAASSVVTFLVQRTSGATTSLHGTTAADHAANALVSYVRYLGKTIWPEDLIAIYPYQFWASWQWICVLIFLLVVTAVVVAMFRRRPYLAVGWFWYVGTLVPVIGFVQVGVQAMADRYTYLPLIGIFTAAVWFVAEVTAKLDRRIPILTAVTAAMLVGCLGTTSRQLVYWQNSLTLFTHTLEIKSDNQPALIDLGVGLEDAGRYDESLAQFERALQYGTNSPVLCYLLARDLARKGDTDDAFAYYRRALKNSPAYGDAHFGLANLYARQGKFPEAAGEFEAAIHADPDAADAHNNLGAIYMRMGRFDDAGAQLKDALRLKPNFPEAHDQLGSVLLSLGQPAQARVQFAEAVRLKPDFVHARLKLGQLLGEGNNLDQAILQFEEVLKLEPQNAEAAYDLGATFAGENRLNEAGQVFAQVVRMRPNDPDPRIRLAAILTAQAKYENAISVYRDTLKLKPDSAEAMKGLAWILATVPKAELRNGTEAVQLAKKANELTGHKQPGALAALDVAYAEAGRFDDAIKAVQETQKLAAAQNNQDVAVAAAKRLELYRAGKPFHQ